MSSTERAVIYVDSGSELSSRSGTSTTNNYVIKIQIGEERMFSPVRIDVAASRRQMIRHAVDRGEESPLNSSGQSSPRSDMTPPPPPRLNPGNIGSSRFGSEGSESDTESDVSSAEYHNTGHGKPLGSAAQFAMRELVEPCLSFGGLHLGPIPEGVAAGHKVATFESLKVNLNQSLKNVFGGARPPVGPILKPKAKAISPEPPRTEFQILKAQGKVGKSVGFRPPPPPPSETRSMIYDQTSFHLNEFNGGKGPEGGLEPAGGKSGPGVDSLTNFAGYKDIFSRAGREGPNQIMSDKGTIRGVKNRVRDGIATFLQSTDTKNYNEKEKGRVVVYVTSMGVVRDTYMRCVKVKQILRNLLIKFDERDCYMNREVQDEIRERLPVEDSAVARLKKKGSEAASGWQLTKKIGLLPASSYNGLPGSMGSPHISNYTKYIDLPQVFIEGQYLGDADTIEKLNETGELRTILKPYKNVSVLATCDGCGGFRMMPCPVCNGSKKSVHRNHFTEEFVALKCMNCDENGLVRCGSCNARM